MIDEDPVAKPAIIPEAEPIVTAEVLLLLHVPPVKELLSVAVAPWHILVVPAIAAGV